MFIKPEELYDDDDDDDDVLDDQSAIVDFESGDLAAEKVGTEEKRLEFGTLTCLIF